MGDPKQDQEQMDKEAHEFIVKQLAGKTSKDVPDWQGDLSQAIDVWLLREFYKWSQSKKTTFTIQTVDAQSWWERDHETDYRLETTYAGTLDADLSQKVSIILWVQINCGSIADPTSFQFRLLVVGSKGGKAVYTSVGMLLTRGNGRRKEFRISANGQPHDCRL